MKKSFFRHAAMALLAAAVGLLVASPSRADLFGGLGGFTGSIDWHFPDIPSGPPAPHADLTGCTVKGVSMDAAATDFNMRLIADCDGSKTITMTGGNMDRLKIIYTEALAAFLSNGKVTLTNVGKYPGDGEFYQAGTINISN